MTWGSSNWGRSRASFVPPYRTTSAAWAAEPVSSHWEGPAGARLRKRVQKAASQLVGFPGNGG